MASNINNIRNNTNGGIDRNVPSDTDTNSPAEVFHVLRAQESIDNLRSNAGTLSRSGDASSTVDRAFVSRPGLRANPNSSSGQILSNRNSTYNSILSNRNVETASEARPLLSIVGNERLGPGLQLRNANGSTTVTSINSEGLYQELTTNADRSSSLVMYQDFPTDSSGAPTGYRTITTKKDSTGRITDVNRASLLINANSDGSLTANLVDLTDPSSPVNKYSSILTLSSVIDDNGRSLYNSRTTFANGSVATKTHSALSFGQQFDPKMPKGYLTNVSTRAANGTVTNTVLKTLSETDVQGNRVTTITDITNPASPVQISQSSKPDPFLQKSRVTGEEMSEYLDYLSNAGFLDITGDGTLDPKTDLLLINRYARGLRGNALTANLNLGANPPALATMEAKLSQGFSRGLYDIDGSGVLNPNFKIGLLDINLIARYMFGARGSALTDRRQGNDDTIRVADNKSNTIKLNETDPLLRDFRQIFNLDGVTITTNGNTSKLFYVNLEQTASETGYDAGSQQVIRSNNSTAGLGSVRGISAPVLNDVSRAADNRRPVTRLGDLTASTFGQVNVNPRNYGLGPRPTS